jgi:hypothetical protein
VEIVQQKGIASAGALLAKIAEEDPDATVRQAAKKALGK